MVADFLEKVIGLSNLYEVSMCPARRPVNGKSICPASVNHVSNRVRSRGFSLTGGGRQGAEGNSDIPRQSA